MLRFRLPTLVGSLVLGACASDGDFDAVPDPGADEMEVRDPLSTAPSAEDPANAEEPVFLSLEEEEEEFQRRAHTPLSDGERLKVERVLDGMGMSPGEVAIVGQLVLHQDVYTEAEDLLAVPDEVVEKGKLFSQRLTGTIGSPGPLPQEQLAPFYAGRVLNGNKQFFRPWVQTFTAFVVPADDIILSLFRLVTSNINSAADDCLVANGNSGTLRAMTAASYDSNPNRARIPSVRVRLGTLAQACPGAEDIEGGENVKGCSLMLRRKDLEHPDGVTRSTVVIGPRIGLVTGSGGVTGLNGRSRHIVTHEILHTMGFAHSFHRTTDGSDADTQVDSIVVLNTSGANNTISVMQNTCPDGVSCSGANPPDCCSATNDMSLDDIATLDGLYSARPGGNCNYFDDYQTIQ